MEKKLISVCIPAYNAASFIQETLQSISAQTYKNWEVIVVEDGTCDGTKDIVEKFKKQVNQDVTYIRQRKNSGVSASRNRAVDSARGEWIALIDSDDLWHENHLADLVNTANSQPLSSLIHSGVTVFDSESGLTIFDEKRSPEAISRLPLSLFKAEYTIQPSACMIAADLYKQVGGFNIDLGHSEDLEMWFRCARAGCKFAYTGRNTSYYRKHTGGASAHSPNMSVGNAKVYSIHADWDAIPKSIRLGYAASQWLSAARIIRVSDKNLASEYTLKAMKYKVTFKSLIMWLALRVGV